MLLEVPGLIGTAICYALSEAGAKVFIGEIDQNKGEMLAQDIKRKGLVADFLKIDITSEESVISAVARIIQKKEKIDIWINNAYPRTTDWGNKFEDVKPESLKKC